MRTGRRSRCVRFPPPPGRAAAGSRPCLSVCWDERRQQLSASRWARAPEALGADVPPARTTSSESVLVSMGRPGSSARCLRDRTRPLCRRSAGSCWVLGTARERTRTGYCGRREAQRPKRRVASTSPKTSALRRPYLTLISLPGLVSHVKLGPSGRSGLFFSLYSQVTHSLGGEVPLHFRAGLQVHGGDVGGGQTLARRMALRRSCGVRASPGARGFSVAHPPSAGSARGLRRARRSRGLALAREQDAAHDPTATPPPTAGCSPFPLSFTWKWMGPTSTLSVLFVSEPTVGQAQDAQARRDRPQQLRPFIRTSLSLLSREQAACHREVRTRIREL